MDAYVALQEPSQFTVDVLRTAGKKVLNNIGSSNFATVLIPSSIEWLRMQKVDPSEITEADKTLMLQVVADLSSARIVTVGQIEERVWPQGGTVKYTPEGIIVEREGEERTLFTSAPYPTVSTRHGLKEMVVLLGTLFHFSKGKLVKIISDHEMQAKFGYDNAALRPAFYSQLMSVWLSIAQKDPQYPAVEESSSTIKGIAMLSFISSVLANCELLDYMALHSFVVYKFFKSCMGKMMERPHTIKGKDGLVKPLIDRKSIAEVVVGDKGNVKARAAAAAFKTAAGYPARILCGPVPSEHRFVSHVNATIKEAHLAYQGGMIFRGGSDAGVGTFLQSDGFSSMSSTRHNEMCLLSAMVLASYDALVVEIESRPLVPEKKEGDDADENEILFPTVDDIKIDVFVPIGQLMVVHGTLRERLPKWETTIKYILDNSKIHVVDPTLIAYCATNTRSNAHYVKIDSRCVPPVGKGKEVGVTMDMYAASIKKLMPESYTVVIPVISESMLEEADLYSYRNPADFRGILTTCHSLKYRDYFAPTKIVNWLEWTSLIVKANIRYNCYFLNPKTFYSNLSNILVPPPKGVRVECTDDDGWAFGVVASRGDPNAWGEMEDDVVVDESPSVTAPSSLRGSQDNVDIRLPVADAKSKREKVKGTGRKTPEKTFEYKVKKAEAEAAPVTREGEITTQTTEPDPVEVSWT